MVSETVMSNDHNADGFVQDAAECIFFKTISNTAELTDAPESNSFHPEFCHQFFEESETIFGFKSPKILLYYAASSLDIYFAFEYKEKLAVIKPDDPKPDNVAEIIRKELPADVHTCLSSFTLAVEEQRSFRPFGELIHAYKRSNFKTGEDDFFEIYKVTEPSDKFLEHFERMESFSLWFIDAASYIDTDDPRWRYFAIYQKLKDFTGETLYKFIGYSVVYEYFAYPENIRPRVAQILVLPLFQKKGHGVELLQTICTHYRHDKRVIEITAEDPSDNFIFLRDYVDSFNCSSLESFQPDKLMNGFSAAMASEAKIHFKIAAKQARRVYEILRLKETATNVPEDFRNYRLDVKQRLNKPFQKSMRDFIKLRKALTDDELKTTLQSLTTEQRMAQLQKQFEQTIECYRCTINRLKSTAP